MNTDPKLFIRIDPVLDAALRETTEREGRTKTAIVERALRAYIAQSKAVSAAAEVQAKQAA